MSDRVLSQLLSEMDGLEPLVNVIIIAATNKPDLIVLFAVALTELLIFQDAALLRPGRFDRHIFIAPPDFDGRKEIFSLLFKKMPFKESIDIDALATSTADFTGAEITSLCQNAAIRALEQDISAVTVPFTMRSVGFDL